MIKKLGILRRLYEVYSLFFLYYDAAVLLSVNVGKIDRTT